MSLMAREPSEPRIDSIAAPAICRRPRRLFEDLVLATVALGLASCESTTGVEDETSAPTPSRIVVLGGNTQNGRVGSLLADPVKVRVVDKSGIGVADVVVSWTVNTGGGSVSPRTVVSDAGGQAAALWTLGPSTGVQEVDAAVDGLSPVSFFARAEPGPPAELVLVSGDQQSGKLLTPLSDPLVVQVLDAYGNGVDGTEVSWTVIEERGGSLSPASSESKFNGRANALWTLGTSEGTNTATATAGDLPPVTFTATADMLHFLQVAAISDHTCAVDEFGRGVLGLKRLRRTGQPSGR